MSATVGWLDCSSGASGDMLLGALVGAGVPVETLRSAVAAVAPEQVELSVLRVRRAGISTTRVEVRCAPSTTHRTWREIRQLIESAGTLPKRVRDRVLATFGRLAAAEAQVHGVPAETVHFHEVGALDAIADVVGVCAGFEALGLESLSASPVAVGSGTVSTAHGRLPVPTPAVVELLAGAPTHTGPAAVELTTPTGAALLAEHVTEWGPQPPMRVITQSFGAGARDLPDHPNATRLILGEPAAIGFGDTVLLEANVDDLDPRLWPAVLSRLLDVGVDDAWLVPILMKKGRPAHTLCVLVDQARVAVVQRVMFRETSTIGVREHPVRKHPLDRAIHLVDVDGHAVRIKTASLDGAIVNVQPEYDDVAAAAAATGRPVKAVLAQAMVQAQLQGLTAAPD